ncbi:MAG: hypothetical protein NVS9B4_05550 [Candidatus Acidiferrum sp.]
MQDMFVNEMRLDNGRSYTSAFITVWGIPEPYGTHRSDTGVHALEAMRKHLQKKLNTALQGTFALV